jgi:hypothetical protein
MFAVFACSAVVAFVVSYGVILSRMIDQIRTDS